ncbi:MAG: PEP-CTERM sorting domain-containing protein, partial [Chthoniobacteraceae bacterium]
LNGASLELLPLNGFLAANGQLFFILNNDGADSVMGTFAQGSTVTAGSQIFAISYAANSGTNSFTGGNDIALTLIPEPSTASLAIVAAVGIGLRRRPRQRA